MRLKQRYDEAVRVARDYCRGEMQGTARATQVLALLCDAGGDAFDDGAAGAYFDDCIANRDQLVEDLLLHAGVVLVGDPPRRQPAPFTVQGAGPVTPRERAFVQDARIRYLVAAGFDPTTQRPVCWPLELNRTLELHARATHAGCRRRALVHLLRARDPSFLNLLQHATGITA